MPKLILLAPIDDARTKAIVDTISEHLPDTIVRVTPELSLDQATTLIEGFEAMSTPEA